MTCMEMHKFNIHIQSYKLALTCTNTPYEFFTSMLADGLSLE